MYKVKKFFNLSTVTTYGQYRDWINENQNIDIISVTNLDNILIVTYRERNAKLAN